MDTLTFDQLPQAVNQLHEKLERIERLLQEQKSEPQPEPDKLLTVEEAASYLKLSVPTVYGLISKGELPVMKPGKRCYFYLSELDNYLKKSRRKTNAELEAIAVNKLTGKKGGKHGR